MQLRAQRTACDASSLKPSPPLRRSGAAWLAAPGAGQRQHGRPSPSRGTGAGAPALRVQAVADFVKLDDREAILCQKFAAHASAVSSVLVLQDADNRKQIITASLDKTLALWTSEGECDSLCGLGYVEEARLSPGGSPIFCMARDSSPDGQPNAVFLGNHAKQVVAWVPPNAALEENVVLDGHCGWVRSLAASQGRWLFSCACNTLQQWDLSRAIPSLVSTVTLEKGDILCLAASKDFLYAGNADGSIRCWSIGRKAGELYTGGDDQLVRRWQSGLLVPAAPPLFCHNHSVRALAAGGRDLLVSGDKGGELAVWKV